MIELSKSDKNTARLLIDKGLDREYEVGLKKAAKMIEEWLKGNLDNRDAYMKLYKQITDYDYHIAKRYNNISGSSYLTSVIGLVYDEVIKEDELNDFSEDVKMFILGTVRKLKDK